MIKVTELLLALAEDGLLAGQVAICAGMSMAVGGVHAALEPLMQELEVTGHKSFDALADALLWGGDNRMLGAIVDDDAWCAALGDDVCQLDVDGSTGDWCLGMVLSADAMLESIASQSGEGAADDAVMRAVSVRCREIMKEDTEQATAGIEERREGAGRAHVERSGGCVASGGTGWPGQG